MRSPIADEEDLYRRVHPDQMKPNGTVTSAAFKDQEMSVDRAKKRTPEDSLARHPKYGLASFKAALARRLNQQVEPDGDLANPAHALVIGQKTRSIARSFAANCVVVRRAATQE